ncbi:hypothetical protein IE077_004239 [Cardiosporidium cionae]|uniref:Uncharacterized protein n=1 Tax=Cardiosporidium cionae TaxID=476202 RepID=A0ABQ7JD57_9APIC|nr:hypothetical protein IE077_004239 [Cardiosporidium cionae]|eukprot:KAF8821976.1 hypothetical protein IE077_004239 [Cardiosporidium cionae]
MNLMFALIVSIITMCNTNCIELDEVYNSKKQKIQQRKIPNSNLNQKNEHVKLHRSMKTALDKNI